MSNQEKQKRDTANAVSHCCSTLKGRVRFARHLLEEMRAAAIVGKDKSREAFILIHMKRTPKVTVRFFLSPTFGAVGRV